MAYKDEWKEYDTILQVKQHTFINKDGHILATLTPAIKDKKLVYYLAPSITAKLTKTQQNNMHKKLMEVNK